MIDLVIPTYNQSAFTRACFRSIGAARGDLRIVWVDNGSDDHDIRRARRVLEDDTFPHPWTLCRFETNQGFVKATNKGIELARPGADICLQNNDTVAPPDLYERLAAHLDADHGDIIGPQSTSGWQSVKRLAVKWPKHADLARLNLDDVEGTAAKLAARFPNGDHAPLPVGGMVAFFCTLIRRKVVDTIGGLDDAFGVGLGDDDDYCARAAKAGFRVTLALDAFCWHAHRTTFKALYSPPQIAAMQERAAAILKERAQ